MPLHQPDFGQLLCCHFFKLRPILKKTPDPTMRSQDQNLVVAEKFSKMIQQRGAAGFWDMRKDQNRIFSSRLF